MDLEGVTMFRDNEKRTPTLYPLYPFSEGTPVMVTKDYSEIDPYYMQCFTRGAVGIVLSCGMSIYSYDSETQFFTKLVEDTEWCLVDLAGPPFEKAEGFVKVEDLYILTDQDFL